MDKSLHVSLTYFLSQLGGIFFIYPNQIIASVQQGHWIPIFVGVAVNFIVLAVYMKGLSHFPHKDLIGIYSGINKAFAVLVMLPIIFYLYMVCLISIRAFADIITMIFLANTPLWAVTGLLLLISTYMAAFGVATIFRTSILLTILFLPPIAFILCISFQNVDWHYIVPLIEKHFAFLASDPYMKSNFVFSSSFLFLGFLRPKMTFSSKQVLVAALALIPFLLMAVYIPLLTFGRATAATFKFPFVMVVGTIHINWLMFDRVTLFLLLSVITFTMLFIALLVWQMRLVLNRALPKIKSVYTLLFIAVCIYGGCILVPDWQDVEELFFCNTVLRLIVWLGVPFSVYFFGLREKRKGNYEYT